MTTSNISGIRVEEERGPGQYIPRLSTARTAFVGRTLRGPVNRSLFLKSFADFQAIFGGLWQPSPLGYAVQQFFDNGGREALVVRVVNGARAATLTLPAGDSCLCLRAVRPGTREFLRASVDYDNVPAGESTEFNLTVQRVRTHGTEQIDDQEIFRRLSVSPASERYVNHMLAESELVQPAGPAPPRRPDMTLDPCSGLATGYVSSSADGDDGAPVTDYDVIGCETENTGLFALDVGEPFNFLCIPPLARDRDIGPGTLMVAARYCRERRALLIVDPPSAWETADDALRGLRRWDFASENALMYFPRILAFDKLRGHYAAFPPCGAVAGMLARSDAIAPLGGVVKFDTAILRHGQRPCCLVEESKRLRLAKLGVNTLQATRSAARITIAPRTLAPAAAGTLDWQSLERRRLALFILNCVERGTRWVLGRPDPESIALAARQVHQFLERLHASGGFGERAAGDAFFVVSDGRVNTSRERTAGGFALLIGFGAARPGEFHTFKIVHLPGGTAVLANPARLPEPARLPAESAFVDELGWTAQPASQLAS